MSFLNTITDKAVGSALGANSSLALLTSTSYAEAGTSLSAIANNATKAAYVAADNTGYTNSDLTRPITTMMQTAAAADPANTVAITNAGNTAISKMDTSFNSSLPGLNNSIYDVQTASRESISSSVDYYGSALASISPGIAGSVTSVGTSLLPAAGAASDKMCSAVYNAASQSISSAVSNINSTLINKATSSIPGSSDITSALNGGLPSTPDSSSVKALLGGSAFSTSSTTTNTTTTGTAAKAVTYPASGFQSPYNVASTTKIAEETPPSSSVHTTDVIYQGVSLYIEGVEVPFVSITVNQAIGQLPTASFELPSQAGLMDIARYYQPKVHIFYTDQNLGGKRLLFWGHIAGVNYNKSSQNGSASITFECVHKNAIMQQLTFEWSGGGVMHATDGTNLTDTNPDLATVQLHNFNSELTMVKALQGITGLQSDAADLISTSNVNVEQADITKLDARFAEYEKRMVGMPTSIMNLWNQVKAEIFSNGKLNLIFTKMYLPLVEDGIAFFDRMSGHYFLENQIQNSKQSHCNDYGKPEASKYPTMLPPAFRMNTLSAIQTSMAVKNLSSLLGFSGEFMSFYDLFMNFYYGVEYDMVTLASPAEVPIDPTIVVDPDDLKSWNSQPRMALETIVKPQLPFYYSPLCNVILPNMFHSIEVRQAEADIPTRITAVSTAAGQATDSPGALGLNYRAPQSIRESVAFGRKLIAGGTDTNPTTLKETTSSSFNIPGKYEMGRGIKHKKINMPHWLSHFAAGSNGDRAAGEDEQFPVQGTEDYKNMSDLKAAWIDRYGYSAVATTGSATGNSSMDQAGSVLNPYDQASEIMAYERLLFAAADYEYTKEVVKSKTGTVQALFNPYIIPGYPMDIIDKSPNHPSFHAMCASVSHTITPTFTSTTINFMAAITYTEMSNYFLQPIHPWLQNALKLLNVSRGTTASATTSLANQNIQNAKDSVLSTAASTSAALKGVATTAAASIPTPPATPSSVSAFLHSDAGYGTSSAAADSSSQNSTAYGLTANAAYDSNTGDVNLVVQGLINNPRAKAVADQFYQSTLGVGCCDPSMIYDFNSGNVQPVKRSAGVWAAGSTGSSPTKNGGEGNDNLTAVGNLRLVSRPIEGRNAIQDKFYIKFIDLSPGNYSGTPAVYQNQTLTNKTLLEPGASPFLDYVDIPTLINTSTI